MTYATNCPPLLSAEVQDEHAFLMQISGAVALGAVLIVSTVGMETPRLISSAQASTQTLVASEALKTWAIHHANVLSAAGDERVDALVACHVVRTKSANPRKLGRR